MRREEFFRFLTKIKYSDFVKAISFWPGEYCFISCLSPIIISKNILTKNEERGIVLFLDQNGPKIGCSDLVKTISLKSGEDCLYQVHHFII